MTRTTNWCSATTSTEATPDLGHPINLPFLAGFD
jgi:hypothetical protein